MVEQFKNKKVPWAQLEEYIKLHEKTIGSYLDLLNEGDMDKPEIEGKLPKSFSNIHSLLTKILKENNVLPDKEEQKGDQL